MALEINEMNIDDGDGDNQQSESRMILGSPASVKITIDGTELAAEVGEISLTQAIDDHHTLAVRVHSTDQMDGSSDVPDTLPYADFLGKSISLSITPYGEQVDQSLGLQFIGTITRVDLDYSVDGISFDSIIARGPTIAMDGARKNVFHAEVSPGDAVGSILSNYPVTLGKVDNFGETSKFFVQYRETDYEFVMRLATGAGYFAYYDGTEFRVQKAESSGPVSLSWRETLGAFSVGLGTESAEFNSQVLNYEQNKRYEQDTKQSSQQASLSEVSRRSPNASEQIFRDSGFSTSTRSVDDAKSLDVVLQRDKSRAMDRMINCNGQSCVPAVKVGECVTVRGMGSLDGDYWVTKVTHSYDARFSYHNTFECTPLEVAFPQSISKRKQLTDLQRAIVTDNVDPDEMGRIKVKFPWSDPDSTCWARFAVPHAGSDHGWYSVPEINDEVLVGFEYGSPDYPVILGAMYNSTSMPQSDIDSQENTVKLFLTKGGNKITITDKDGEEAIEISTKDGDNTIVLDAAGPSISVTSIGDVSIKGKNISIEGEQEVNVTSGTDMVLDAGANMDVGAAGNLDAKASANVKIEGAMVDLKGQGPVNVKGAIINLN